MVNIRQMNENDGANIWALHRSNIMCAHLNIWIKSNSGRFYTFSPAALTHGHSTDILLCMDHCWHHTILCEDVVCVHTHINRKIWDFFFLPNLSNILGFKAHSVWSWMLASWGEHPFDLYVNHTGPYTPIFWLAGANLCYYRLNAASTHLIFVQVWHRLHCLFLHI